MVRVHNNPCLDSASATKNFMYCLLSVLKCLSLRVCLIVFHIVAHTEISCALKG